MSLGVFYLVTIVSLGHGLVLGLPCYIILSKFRWVNIYTAGLSGLLVGAIPFGVWSWQGVMMAASTEASNNRNSNNMVDGVLSIAGWFQYVNGVLFFAAIGFICALTFWLIVNNYDKSNGPKAARPLS